VTALDVDTARSQFEAEGFCFAPRLVDDAGVAALSEVCAAVMAGTYATGIEPHAANWKPGDDPSQLVKIDQPQRCDHRMSALLAASGIGAFAAGLMGASAVQVWAVQLLHKPPAADGRSHNTVGWHQDEDYWHDWWEGEVFTCWLALSDVTAESGPMRFVPRSHTWGFLASGNFYETDLSSQRDGIPVPPGEAWSEVPAILGPGEASFHHRRTVHGSGVNVAASPRRSLAIHLRTEKSAPVHLAPPGYTEDLANPDVCPVLFGTL
jgi:ectoine hydroxylase-related dioxygenase (phytanoyl-CoA dioxygenase family)